MPEWSAEVWGIVVSAAVGVAGVLTAVVALVKSSTANKHADEANRIAKDANRIALDALKVQERGVEVTLSSERRSRSAELYIRPPTLSAKRGKARFYLHNHGPSDAFDVELALHHGDACLSFGNHDRITAGGLWPFEQSAERFIAQLGGSSELRLELRAVYRDGNGPQIARWHITVAPGEQFVDRKWTVEKLPDGGC